MIWPDWKMRDLRNWVSLKAGIFSALSAREGRNVLGRLTQAARFYDDGFITAACCCVCRDGFRGSCG